jgi:hypothetical protein
MAGLGVNGSDPRTFVTDAYQAIDEENTWGFGQVVAVGILVLPFLTFFGKSLNSLKYDNIPS